MIRPEKLATALILAAFFFLALALLTGCSTLGISFETDYGRFTYQLPEMPARTLGDK
jgi:hypothetical protein